MRETSQKRYLLGVLLVIAVFNFADRLALGIALQDIKTEFDLSDTQLGLLTGIAFALFYSVMGIPIARWADRGNRIAIISVTTMLWSIAVMLSGIAESYLQLVLIRIAVAVGEAGCLPPALSLIADYFDRAERPRATAIYLLSAALSGVVGYFLAGLLIEAYGWRVMFMLLGMPGLMLAAVAWLTLKEPRRTSTKPFTEQPSLKDVALTLKSNATFRHLLLSLSVSYFFGYGILQWQPSFFIRSHGLTSGEVGAWMTGIAGVAGFIGAYLGGDFASRFAPNNERLQLKGLALATAASGLLMFLGYLTTHLYAAFSLMGLAIVGLSAGNGPFSGTIQTLIPERMRAVAFALIYLCANLIGMGLGPLAAGVLSDAFQSKLGEESLRYAILALTPGYVWVAWHVWRASQTVTRDISTKHSKENPASRRP